MRVIVTGASGFIGSHILETLVSHGHEVLGIDGNLESTYSAKLKEERFTLLRNQFGNILIKDDLRTMNLDSYIANFDAVIHCAAIPGLTLSWEDIDLYTSCNINATQRLLDSIVRVNNQMKFIHISTSSVYGETATGDEDSELVPYSPYGVTKLASENLIRAYAKNFGIRFTILRYFSVYGPRQRPDMAYAKFIESFLQRKPIFVYGDGSQIRTNTFITDCVNGTISALLNSQTNQIYNISGGYEISVMESINTLIKVSGIEPKIIYKAPRPGDQQLTRGNIKRANLDLNFKPQIMPKDGLRRQFEYFVLKGHV